MAQSLAALDAVDRLAIVALGRPDLDITDRRSVQRVMVRERPDIVVNAAAYTAVDKAESEPEPAFAVNRDGAYNVAATAADAGCPLIHISTDYVFSGKKNTPYDERDPTKPATVYGRSKLEGEWAVERANCAHVILRTSWVHSPYGSNFVKTMLRLARERGLVRVVADQWGAPTYAPDIAGGISVILQRVAAEPQGQEWRGVFHVAAGGETTWAGFAEAVFKESARRNGPAALVEAITTAEYPTPARRPANSRLDSSRYRQTFGSHLPDWRDGVRRCVAALSAERIHEAS